MGTVSGFEIQTPIAADSLLHLKRAAKKMAMGVWIPTVGVIPTKMPRANPRATSRGSPRIIINRS